MTSSGYDASLNERQDAIPTVIVIQYIAEEREMWWKGNNNICSVYREESGEENGRSVFSVGEC